MDSNVNEILSQYLYIGGLDGHPKIEETLGAYGYLKKGHWYIPESDIGRKGVTVKYDPIGGLPDGTYFAKKRPTSWFPFQTSDPGMMLSTDSTDASYVLNLKNIHYIAMSNVQKEVLEKLMNIRIAGKTLPEFFYESTIFMFYGILFGKGTVSTVGFIDGISEQSYEAHNVCLGVKMLCFKRSLFTRELYPVFYPPLEEEE